MRKERRAEGGSTPAMKVATGTPQATRTGPGAKAMSLGRAMGRRGNFAEGGHTTNMDRLHKATSRDEKLEKVGYATGGSSSLSGGNFKPNYGTPSADYKRGGSTRREHHGWGKQVGHLITNLLTSPHVIEGLGRAASMLAEGGKVNTEALRRGGRAKKRSHEMCEHHYEHHDHHEPQARRSRSKRTARRAEGGHMWIAEATQNKGGLHKNLGIPEGRKIPERRLLSAERSRSPVLRKEAHLATTLKGFRR